MDNPQFNSVNTQILELAKVDAKYLKELENFRQSLAVMFTDIKGSTAYFDHYGDVAGLMMLHDCHQGNRKIVEKNAGRVIKTIGDGMMTTFSEPRPAVEAAVSIQKALVEANSTRPEPARVAIRIGIHYGAGFLKDGDVFGDVVNVASRVESVALPGQIVISDALYHLVSHSTPYVTRELGHYTLKGKAAERTLFEVIWDDEDPGELTLVRTGLPLQKPKFKLQLISDNKTVAREYPVVSAVTIGRCEGDIQFPSDASMSPLNARIFAENGQLFVEDLSSAGESVFIRVLSGYTLQDGDIVIMGQQVFRFSELPEAMNAVTQLGLTVFDLSRALQRPIAELARLDADGNCIGHCPLGTVAADFGRTRGHYTFPDDKLMSRVHARILQRGGDFLIEDAGSRNGTFVKVRGKTLLQVGSTLLVGQQLLRVIQ